MNDELIVENLLDFVLSSTDVEIKIKFMINECEKYRKIVSATLIEICITILESYCVHK